MIKIISKHIILFWLVNPLIDYIFNRLNLGVYFYFKFNLIIFPIEISYHIGKINYKTNITNSDFEE